MKRLLTFFVLLFSFIVIPFSVNAQLLDKKTSLGVTPAIVEVILDPKKPSQRIIILTNLTNYALPIKTLKESFTPKEKLEIPKGQLDMYDASSWISLSEKDTDFIMQPKEIRKIRVTVTQSKKATPGGHYASLIFQPLVPEQAVAQDSVYVFARVAVLFFMQVKGDIVEDLSIEKTDIKKVYKTTPIIFGIDLKNNGNTHIRPNGMIQIFQQGSSKPFANVTLKPSLVLPGTTKHFEAEWNGSQAWGNYKAKAVINYSADNKVLESKLFSFSIFPYISVLLKLIVAAAFIWILYKFRDRLKKAAIIIIHGEKKEYRK